MHIAMNHDIFWCWISVWCGHIISLCGSSSMTVSSWPSSACALVRRHIYDKWVVGASSACALQKWAVATRLFPCRQAQKEFSWSWKVSLPRVSAWGRHQLANLFSFSVNLAFFSFLLIVTQSNFISLFIAVCLTTLLNYFLASRWVHKTEHI